MDDPGHLADVEVHAHEDGLAGLDRLLGGVLLPAEGGVDGPRHEVDELAAQVGADQLRWIGLHQ
ncbi:hypothetical protein D9M68_985180 [compost metagenome]